MLMDDRDSSPATLVGEVVGDRYRLDAVLGAGGMGAVYLATDEQLSGRRVAIKVPHDEFLLVPGFLERFGQEIRQLLDLEHPHIVTILDGGEFEGRPFAVLQYLGGGSLSDRLDELGRNMTVAEVLEWLPTVAQSLDFIHRRGFLHRDIKPGNIFFDAEGHAFVADFGIALALGGEGFTRMTQAGTLLGSPAYMAPECGSGEAGPPYDQYALGVLVYECLSGEFPHAPQPTPIAYLAKKMGDPPRPLAPLAPGASEVVVGAVMRTLAVRPEDRFETCAAFAAAVADGASLAPAAPAKEPRRLQLEGEPVARAPVYRLVDETSPPVAVEGTEPLDKTAVLEEDGSEPLAATAFVEDGDPELETTTTVVSEPKPAATHPLTQELVPAAEPVHSAEAELAPVVMPEPAGASPPVVKRASRADDTAVLIWNMLRPALAFVTGFLVLAEGSYAFFALFNPLASIESNSGLLAVEDQTVFLVTVTATVNLVLSLLAGYTAGVISEQQWKINGAVISIVAVALTSWETGLLVPLFNSRALGFLTFDGAWLSMAPVPLGLLAGGYARSRQDNGRQAAALFAAMGVAIVVVLRLVVAFAQPA